MLRGENYHSSGILKHETAERWSGFRGSTFSHHAQTIIPVLHVRYALLCRRSVDSSDVPVQSRCTELYCVCPTRIVPYGTFRGSSTVYCIFVKLCITYHRLPIWIVIYAFSLLKLVRKTLSNMASTVLNPTSVKAPIETLLKNEVNHVEVVDRTKSAPAVSGQDAAAHEKNDDFEPSIKNRYGLKSPWEAYFHPIDSSLHGRFEVQIDDVVIFGEIPKNISGTWYRQMLDPHHTPAHDVVFTEGDSHLSAFRIQNGKMSHKTKYLHTERWLLERKYGKRLFHRYRNPYDSHPCVRMANDTTGNTNVLYWAGDLLAVAERGLPYSVDPDTLETRKADPYGGQTKAKTFAAHPKIDPFKNELVTWSYSAKGLASDDVATYSIDDKGKIHNELWFKPEETGMMHDGWITENWIILSDLPYRKSTDAELQKCADYWTYVPGQANRFLVAPRTPNAPRHPDWKVGEYRSYTFDEGMVLHCGNSWEDEDGKLILEGHLINFNVFYFSNPPGFQGPIPAGGYYRYTIDPGQPTNTPIVQATKIFDGVLDFPAWDERFSTRPTTKAYIAGFSSWTAARRGFNKIIKIDTESSETQIFDAGDDGNVAEPTFIPRSDDAPEGDGYLIFSLTRDSLPGKADLVIVDTSDITKPIAIALLPFAGRAQLHGNWVPNPHPERKLDPLTGPVKQDVPVSKEYSQLNRLP